MSNSQEKDLKSGVVISESSDNEKGPQTKPKEVDSPPAYVESERSWKSFFWSTLDVPKEEARYLTKLDLTLITASALGVMCRYLDQANITNAFNSGMKEELSLYGDELNYANGIWGAAYVLGQIPSNLILTRVNAPLYIAFLELGWTVFTFAHAGARNVNDIYVFRFFVGLFEAGHFPAVMYVCSSYYKPHELARRNASIQVFTAVGPLFSGFLMAAVFSGLDGVHGLAGWRWMFIVCGCVSFPCAVWTAFAMPQLPGRAKANWVFTQKEVELGRLRMPTEKKMYTGLFKWKDIKSWHTTWHAWLFPLFFAFTAQFGQVGGSMIFWVKSYNVKGQTPVFSVAEINIIPLAINIITIFATLALSWISDSLPGAARWPGLLFTCLVAVVIPTALGATPVHPANKATRWALYYLAAFGQSTGSLSWTWVNETSRDDPEKRAYVSALMNAFAFTFTAFVPIFTFPASKQPYIVHGYFITSGFAGGAIICLLFMAYFHSQDVKKKRQGEERESVAFESTPL